MVVILVLGLLYFTITEMWRKVDNLPTIRVAPSKSVENYEKLKLL
jgi:hypothetical protein